MEWIDIIIGVSKSICIGICTLFVPYGFHLIKAKMQNKHFKELLESAEKVVISSVQMVNQRMVDALKKQGEWDIDAMDEAYDFCLDNIRIMLNEEAKAAIIKQHGNLDDWLDTMIEATVRQEKYRHGA